MNIGDNISVIVPHRISGLFQIVESSGGRRVDDISKVGSRGGGPSITAYGKTTIKITDIFSKDDRSKCQIFINGEDCTDTAKTTFYVFSHVMPLFKTPVKVDIYHEFEIPMGAGYASSAVGAIGAAFALNNLLNLSLSYNQAGKIAHFAEVLNETGLGSVAGIIYGGLSLITNIGTGFPFSMDQVIIPPNVKIICSSFGSIPTGSIIGKEGGQYKEKIIKFGAWAVGELMKFPVFQRFIDISRQFVDKIGLLNLDGMEETRSLIQELNKLDVYGASMNQLGKSVYCFCDKDDEKKVIDVCESYSPNYFKSLEVCHYGPILL